MNYKSYQQVLDLSGNRKSSPKARPVQPTNSDGPKRRTKSGCMTCRKRKKKCDEEVEGGKCQACIRNFLDCCWSAEKPPQPVESLPLSLASQKLMVPKSPLLEIKEKTVPASQKGASAYPSPISSPKARPMEETKTIQSLSLPPIKMKIEKPQKKTAISKAKSEFIVTSFDSQRALCQIK
ncbi:hypothetical protein METBIDRAFT_79441 [Metschnikowia bicuspidata var. bicuspidata NRRL YB-4993]|uniref:Zn(2)-C6 fungal-type domain-containing protein n=1 Tax=Metschnikowia bicuspidata var. bicuspidata NRRL YB-4993 TaxID=869754 RepID=A0A1A0H8D5_9ASCO|nr:hypothetical protein METBIDRAFT_79441 [Metschnikowia bicuspidata var. bicuspidata NRRL YB-4993]OBA20153.1 hypothetical protein METBIDRAFT_79441 [Metschnikowia bicuspidata var. bicuspidata NRRL YB-4993]